MRFGTVVIALSALLPFAAATATSCGKNEFWYTKKSCCLPTGGPSTTPTPPKDTDCPPTNYYWSGKQSCCVPRNPPPSNHPEPQCRKDWEWHSTLNKCQPCATTTSSSTPSQTPGKPNNGGHKKRSHKSRVATLCPTGLDACPIKGLTAGEYECLDTDAELESCGGCVTMGKGQDCTSIKGAWNVGCEQGSCVVYSCSAGFTIGLDGKSCVPL